ncbi:hypothetical protein [Clostridium sardiniense]|uniref:hypothetical protein n=1 Tax=Clostridium sardiniense TaxID=29369 RepID=UPI003D32E37A
MEKYYKRIFWGYLLVILDINLSMNGINIDILPDFIGYIMIGKGLYNLSRIEGIFKKEVNASYILSAVEILKIFVVRNVGTASAFIFMIIESTLWLFVIYSICKGVENEGIKYNKEHISDRAKIIWELEFIRTMILMSVSSVTFNFNQGIILSAVSILLIAFTICITVMLLRLLYIVGDEFYEIK